MAFSAALLSILISLNIGTTVTLVVFNKELFIDHGFTAIGLACTHYLVQWVFFVVGVQVGFVKMKRVPLVVAAKFAFLVALAVTFSNESLKRNSVGFFQLTKMLAIPWTAVLEKIVFGKKQTPRSWGALLMIGFAVGLATINDFSANWVGTAFAVVAFVAAPLGNAYMSYWMQILDINATQLSVYYMPIVAALLGVPLVAARVQALFAPQAQHVFSEWTALMFNLPPNLTARAMVALAGSLSGAFLGNITTATILKSTSAATFQVVSAAKTCAVMLAGIVFFGDMESVTPRSLIGLALGLLGIAWYQHEKRQQAAKEKLG